MIFDRFLLPCLFTRSYLPNLCHTGSPTHQFFSWDQNCQNPKHGPPGHRGKFPLTVVGSEKIRSQLGVDCRPRTTISHLLRGRILICTTHLCQHQNLSSPTYSRLEGTTVSCQFMIRQTQEPSVSLQHYITILCAPGSLRTHCLLLGTGLQGAHPPSQPPYMI